MELRDDQTVHIQKLVNTLYHQPLTADRILQLSPLICRITDSHYFALVFLPGENVPEPIYFSNNPDEFNSRYNEVQSMDFMLHRLIQNVRPVQFTEIVREPLPNKEEFLVDLNRIRPVSDCIYTPITLQNRISGFIGIAREGSSNSPFNENEAKIIDFVSSFIIEAVSRSLCLPDVKKQELILDRNAAVLKADDSAREILVRLFAEHWESPLWGESEHAYQFRKFWERFTSPIRSPGDSIMEFELEGRKFRMEFEYAFNPFLQPALKEAPYVKVLISEGHAPHILHRNNNFNLTEREQEVVNCIYQGFSNKEISKILHISMSTVKKHIWNIYNKVGVDNRTSLIFTLSQ